MTTPTTVPAGLVARKGLIFRFGDYPDRRFALTAERFAAAYPDGDMGHVPVVYGHTRGFLDDRLGRVATAHVRGDELHAELLLNPHFDALIAAHERKVSCEFDRATGRLLRVGITPHPRVPDAVLLSLEAPAPGAAAADGPARFCADDPDCDCDCDDRRPQEPPEARPMAAEDEPLADDGAADGLTVEDLRAQVAALQAREQEREAALLALQEQSIRKEAVGFVDDLVRDGRATPAERANLVALFERVAIDDLDLPEVVAFSADGKPAEGPRLDLFKATLKGRPRHGLTAEKVASTRTTLLDPDDAARFEADDPAIKARAEARRRRAEKAGKTAGHGNNGFVR